MRVGVEGKDEGGGETETETETETATETATATATETERCMWRVVVGEGGWWWWWVGGGREGGVACWCNCLMSALVWSHSLLVAMGLRRAVCLAMLRSNCWLR